MKSLFTFLLLNCFLIPGSAQPIREMRAIWLTTFSNIDWPQRNASSEEQQKSLIHILDEVKLIGFNTIFFQVRSQCDAMYNSTIEPWSADLTGKQGTPPVTAWDPLAFAVMEAHKRGLELHAWINPYRAVANINALPYFSPNHIANKKPEWLLNSGTLRTLDPGIPDVRKYILKVISDIVARYDIDGIHFDDYFYPEGGFNDNATFSKYPSGFENKSDWRRNNVNLLIADCKEIIHSIKPWVKFGVSPTGIYLNSKDPLLGTPTTGKQHFSELYCDSRLWLKMHWIDYLLPQVYWYSTQPGSPFNVIAPWWSTVTGDRQIYIGLAGYKVGIEKGWESTNEIPNQIKLVRQNEKNGLKGISLYNTKSLLQNRLGFRDSIKAAFNKVSMPPQMPWIDNIPPPSLQKVSVKRNNSSAIGSASYTVTWNQINNDVHEMDKTIGVGIYYSLQVPDVSQAQFLGLFTAHDGIHYAEINLPETIESVYFFASAVDRLYNESVPVLAEASFIQQPPIAVNKMEASPLPLTTETQSPPPTQLEKESQPFPPVSNDITPPSMEEKKIAGKELEQEPKKSVFTKPNLKPEENKTSEIATGIQASEKLTIAKDPGLIRKDAGVRILLLKTGIIEYIIYDIKGNKITWGKIKSTAPNLYVYIPSTLNIDAGVYFLELHHEDLKEIVKLRVL